MLRLHRAAKGVKMFTADEVRRLLDAAGPQLRAMIFLAVNAGMGNTDRGRLPLSAVNLDTAWLDYPRPKTGMPRRCWLWPETVQAIREAIDMSALEKLLPPDEIHRELLATLARAATWALLIPPKFP